MKYCKLEIYVPESHVEAVKTAVCDAGAGRLGNYDCCVWAVPGSGQFRPLDGSSPFLGSRGQVESVAEYKLEMICDCALMPQIIAALRSSHPYETPAFQYWNVQIQ